jgi:excisionase family DNA binding protein
MEQKMITLRKPPPSPIQNSMPDIAEFMTTQEAADKLGFTLQGVSRMIRQKRLDAVRIGRTWLVSRKSVQEYLKKTDGMSKNDPRRKAEK